MPATPAKLRMRAVSGVRLFKSSAHWTWLQGEEGEGEEEGHPSSDGRCAYVSRGQAEMSHEGAASGSAERRERGSCASCKHFESKRVGEDEQNRVEQAACQLRRCWLVFRHLGIRSGRMELRLEPCWLVRTSLCRI